MTDAAAPTSAALTRLRAAMRPHHDRIETIVDLMRPDLSIADYRRFIERSYGFISACERALDHEGAPPVLQLGRRLKTSLLVSDLRAMGATAVEIEALPMPVVIPAVSAWPAALGYCYVIEGSTLGGQVLSRHLSSTLSLPAGAMTFLRSYEREVGPMWKSMLAVLDAALAEETRATDLSTEAQSAKAEGAESTELQITDTARDTFELLGRWHAA